MKKIVMKIIFTSLTLLWMGIIFYFSNQTGAQSSSISGKVTEPIVKLFVTDYANLPLAEQEKLLENYSFFIRKTAHYMEFGILSLFLFLCLKQFVKKEAILYPLVLGICIIYAISDEIHQFFISSRTPAVKDVFIDSMGAITMLLGIAIVMNIIRIRQVGKKND